MLLLPLLLLSCVSLAHSFRMFQTRIPNGDKVPNPCKPNETWPGVGHRLVGGTGARNPFGMAFEANGEVYSVALCQMDSDGDGTTNGAELGDPDCTWTVGSQPKLTTGLSHPGVCEPLTSPMCKMKNDFIDCVPNSTFVCPALDLPTTKNVSLTFPPTPVPAEETTYICMGFKLPSDIKYHTVGLKSVLNNTHLVHHMLLYGCNNGIVLLPSQLTTPYKCGMAPTDCTALFGLWTIGIEGQCTAPEYGFPMGPQDLQYAVLQIHWNNKEKIPNLVDSSGLMLYYTSQLRPNDGMILMTGQLALTIPPGQASFKATGSCMGECSSLMKPTPMYLAGGLLHMHLTGASGDIQKITPGQAPMPLITEPVYDYNAPIMRSFDTPIEFNAGDEIQVNCVYNSTKRNVTTHWGESAQDEMCFGFMMVYPAASNFSRCLQYEELDVCTLSEALTIRDCNITAFFGLMAQTVCDTNCSMECREKLAMFNGTNCMGGSLEGYFKHFFPSGISPFLQLKDYCEMTPLPVVSGESTQGSAMGSSSPGPGASSPGGASQSMPTSQGQMSPMPTIQMSPMPTIQMSPGQSMPTSQEQMSPGQSMPTSQGQMSPGQSMPTSQGQMSPGQSMPTSQGQMSPGQSMPTSQGQMSPGQSMPTSQGQQSPGHGGPGQSGQSEPTGPTTKKSGVPVCKVGPKVANEGISQHRFLASTICIALLLPQLIITQLML